MGATGGVLGPQAESVPVRVGVQAMLPSQVQHKEVSFVHVVGRVTQRRLLLLLASQKQPQLAFALVWTQGTPLRRELQFSHSFAPVNAAAPDKSNLLFAIGFGVQPAGVCGSP